MSLLIYCSGCKIGEHEHHHRIVQAAPEGMLGGAVCPCQGECVDQTWEQKARNIGALDLLKRYPVAESPSEDPSS